MGRLQQIKAARYLVRVNPLRYRMYYANGDLFIEELVDDFYREIGVIRHYMK